MERKHFELAIDDIEEACLSLANHLILVCKLPLLQVCSLNDVDSNLFTLLFAKICKVPLPDFVADPKNFEERSHNIQVIIDTISLDLLSISLSHITGEDVVAGNVHSVHNLLEVLESILLFNPYTTVTEESVHRERQSSDIIETVWSSNHEVFPAIGGKQTVTRIDTGPCSSCDYQAIITEDHLHEEHVFDDEEIQVHASCKQCSYQSTYNIEKGEGSKQKRKIEDERHAPPLEPHIRIEYHSDVSSFQSDHVLQDCLKRPVQTTAFSSSFGQKHEVVSDPTLRPEFARLGLRDHAIDVAEGNYFENVDPQISFIETTSQHKLSSSTESHPGSYHSLHSTLSRSSPTISVTLNPKKIKPFILSQSVENLQQKQEEINDAYTRQIPINRRRKSRSLEDIYRSPSTCSSRSSKGTKDTNRMKTSKQKSVQRKIAKTKDKAIEEEKFTDLPEAREKNVADLYGINLEMKLKGFLEERNKQKRVASQLEKTYLRAVSNKPRKSPTCKKSYLLPAYLRKSRSNTTPKKHMTRSGSSARIIGKKGERSAEASFLKELKEEFPGVHMSPATIRRMKERYQKQLLTMHRTLKDVVQKKSRTQLQTEEVVKRQAILSDILRKEMEHQEFIKEQNEHKQLQTRVKSSFREAQQQSARTRNYYNEFQNEMKKKIQKRNYKEEVLLKGAFEERLNLQKEQVHLLRQQAKERQEKDAFHHRIYLEALENYYQSQFSMLAESLAIEKRDLQERTKAQRRVLNKMKEDFRNQMLKNVRTIQDQLVRDKEDIHFRELDAERYKDRLRDKYSAHPLRKRI